MENVYPSLSDKALHLASIAIAHSYHNVMANSILNNTPIDDNFADDMILAYRNVRRHITKGPDGKRYGHAEAYKAMTGL